MLCRLFLWWLSSTPQAKNRAHGPTVGACRAVWCVHRKPLLCVQKTEDKANFGGSLIAWKVNGNVQIAANSPGLSAKMCLCEVNMFQFEWKRFSQGFINLQKCTNTGGKKRDWGEITNRSFRWVLRSNSGWAEHVQRHDTTDTIGASIAHVGANYTRQNFALLSVWRHFKGLFTHP